MSTILVHGLHLVHGSLRPSTAPPLLIKFLSVPAIEYTVPSDRFVFQDESRPDRVAVPASRVVPESLMAQFPPKRPLESCLIPTIDVLRARIVYIGLQILIDGAFGCVAYKYLLAAHWVAQSLGLANLVELRSEIHRCSIYRPQAYNLVHTRRVVVFTRPIGFDEETGFIREDPEAENFDRIEWMLQESESDSSSSSSSSD